LGQRPRSRSRAQSAHHVHSKLQIIACSLSGARARPQHSQFGRSSSMARLADVGVIALPLGAGYVTAHLSQRCRGGGGFSGEICMTSFDKREEGFEKKFALDEELRFKATARRNKLLGLWAAEKLGKSGADAETYAKSVVAADFEEAGDEDVFRKVRGDFDAAKVAQSDHQIRRTMDELMAKAVEQIKTGT
jgi:hypothetical protein